MNVLRACVAITMVFALSALPTAARSQDPVEASPGLYKILLEDDRVRILELTYPRGQRESWHTHPRHFGYVVQAGRLRTEREGGETRETTFSRDSTLSLDRPADTAART